MRYLRRRRHLRLFWRIALGGLAIILGLVAYTSTSSEQPQGERNEDAAMVRTISSFFTDLNQRARDELIPDDIDGLGAPAAVVVGAVFGAVLTQVGQALMESRRGQREHRNLNEERSLKAVSDLVQTLTALAQALESAGPVKDSLDADRSESAGRKIEDLIADARSRTAMARLVCPDELVDDLDALDSRLSQIADKNGMWRNPSFIRMERDDIIETLRESLNVR